MDYIIEEPLIHAVPAYKIIAAVDLTKSLPYTAEVMVKRIFLGRDSSEIHTTRD